ncbi:MAG: hypothetical protein DRP73_05640, partial [Candidatus Omnitrophota bacterium]
DYIKENWEWEEIISAINLVYQYTYGLIYGTALLALQDEEFPEGLRWAWESSGGISPELYFAIKDLYEVYKQFNPSLSQREFAANLAREIIGGSGLSAVLGLPAIFRQLSSLYYLDESGIVPTDKPLFWWYDVAPDAFVPVSLMVTLISWMFASSAIPVAAGPEVPAWKIWLNYLGTLARPSQWWRVTTSGLIWSGIGMARYAIPSLIAGREIDLKQLALTYSMGYLTGMAWTLTQVPDAVMYRMGALGRRLATNPGGIATLLLSDGARYIIGRGAPLLCMIDKIASTYLLAKTIPFILDVAGVERNPMQDFGIQLLSFLVVSRFFWLAPTGAVPVEPPQQIVGGVKVARGRIIGAPGKGDYMGWIKFMLRDYITRLREVIGGYL